MKFIIKLIKYLFFAVIIFTLISVVIGIFFLPSDVETNKEITKSEKKEKVKEDVKIIKTEKLPDNPKIDIDVYVEENTNIKYLIKTNIPLPIEVMVGLSASGLKPDDAALGFSKRVKITKSPFEYSQSAINDYSLNEEILPSGKYDAEVTFYPNWGAKNGNPLSGKIKEKVIGFQNIELQTSGSVEEQKEKDKKQMWGIKVAINDEWNKNVFIKNLGNYQELNIKNRDPKIVKVYYFQDADMTFFISKPTNKVLLWRIGKVEEL